MIELLEIALRVAGSGLILLAFAHIPIGGYLRWRDDAERLTPANRAIFHVHTFFICLVLAMMGLACLVEPAIFIHPSRAGAWLSWALATFWGTRLFVQWFVYPQHLWRGKQMETAMHWLFTSVWLGLTGLFVLCGAVQAGWLRI